MLTPYCTYSRGHALAVRRRAATGARVKFMVEQVALGEIYLRVLQVSPVCIFPPMVHDHLCITNANIILGINDYKWKNYKSHVIVGYGQNFGITFHLGQLISAEVQGDSLSHF